MIKLCAIMDPLEKIIPYKDTTVGLLFEAQQRQYEIYYCQPQDLYLSNGQVEGSISRIQVRNHHQDWITKLSTENTPLSHFDIILMRKDPPFDIPFLYTTYLLDIAQQQGCFIVNHPSSIRDANERLFANWFPQCCPETLVTSNKTLLKEFLVQHQHIACKQLDSMGGQGVFILTTKSPNINLTFEKLTSNGNCPIMVQRFISEIVNGDKRILMIDGKAYPYALSRIPGEKGRGNLAAGATPVGATLTKRDQWIAAQVGPTLKEKQLLFVGLDVIGDYLTEINVTSPTCVREIEAHFRVNICADILDCLLSNKPTNT